MEIDHGCFNFAMAEQFFDGMDIISIIRHVGSKGMPQRMGRELVLLQAGQLDTLPDGMLYRSIVHGLSGQLPFEEIYRWPVLAVIGFEFLQYVFWQERKAVFVPFAGNYFYLVVCPIYLAHAQVPYFTQAHARAVKHPNDGFVFEVGDTAI